MRLTLIILLFYTNFLFSQKKEEIKVNVAVPYPNYMSLDKVRAISKRKCFEQALEASSSYINIERKSQTITITKNDSIKSDNYYFNFNTDHKARIVDYKIIKENIINKEKEKVLELEMLVSIQPFKTKIDKSFTFHLDINKLNFGEGDFLKFKLKPNQSGYLNVIIIDGEKIYKLFPNELEKGNFFEAKKVYNFPLSQFVEYELEANKNEISNFYFIYTKKDIVFYDNENTKEFLKKLYSLELDERAIEINPITILK